MRQSDIVAWRNLNSSFIPNKWRLTFTREQQAEIDLLVKQQQGYTPDVITKAKEFFGKNTAQEKDTTAKGLKKTIKRASIKGKDQKGKDGGNKGRVRGMRKKTAMASASTGAHKEPRATRGNNP